MPTNKTEETCPKGREYRKTYLNLTKAIEKEDETYKHYSREYRIHKYAPDAVKAKAAEESAKSFRQIRQEVKVKAARNGVALPTITSKSLGRMAYFGSMAGDAMRPAINKTRKEWSGYVRRMEDAEVKGSEDARKSYYNCTRVCDEDI